MAGISTELFLVIIKFFTVLAGFYIVYLAFKAYRQRPAKNVLWLMIGMGILTLGAISEGIAYQAIGWTIDQSHIFEAVVTLVGFTVLVYSVLR
ncbi:MAG TPA: hypothetical protein VGB18_09255 [Candidatus Thermoplasmatota archaeon]